MKPTNHIATQLQLTMADYRQVVKTPLLLLPAELQPAVLRLWVCHRHLAGLETPLCLAGMLNVWLAEFGLRIDDAAAILNGFLSPHKMQAFRFASDLMTALATEAALVIDRRKAEVKREEDLRDRERAKANFLAPEEVRGMLAKARESLGERPPTADLEQTRNEAFAQAARK